MANKTAHGVEIHYNALWDNGLIIAIDDFKFVTPLRERYVNLMTPKMHFLASRIVFNLGLELEKEYLITGIVMAKKQLWYLVDEKGRPNFYPYQLFEISNASLCSGWYFKLYDEDIGIFPSDKQAMWGYHELCFDDDHYEQLLDRETMALEIYFGRKVELEN